jgi:hypothetical protein
MAGRGNRPQRRKEMTFFDELRQWGDSTEGLPPRLRLLLLRLDDWVELEQRHRRGDPTAVEQAQPLLALAEPYSEVRWALHASTVMDAARAVRDEAAWQLRGARERTQRRCRDAYMLANYHCTACRAPIHTSRQGMCWECAQRWDPYLVQDVEAASAAVDRHWRARDAATLFSYLTTTLGIDVELNSEFRAAIQRAMEQGDKRIYRLVWRLARWHAGQADYVTVHDPDALHQTWPLPSAFRWVTPFADIWYRREQRRNYLLTRRAHLRRVRNARRDWTAARTAAASIACQPPHPDIRGIGLEIECGVDTMRLAVAREEIAHERRVTYDDIELAQDVSVYVPDAAGIGSDWTRNAEIKVRIDRAAEWPQWAQRIIALWRAARLQQNPTCGNHVHVMFSNRALRAIARPRFLRWFYQRYWERWGRTDKYTARLDCSYCRWDTPSASAIRHRMDRRGSRAEGSTRYRAVNWHAVCEHGTVEFRLLPHAESGEEYARAVEWLLNTLGDYLRRELDQPQQLSLDLNL